ncbi:hypothetical protein [Stenotrophomonas koreensis]|uniref:hypothetical protein n=1 Tax=Stenotrophomonas koreensis TaxID=266128 RepID=UPI001C722FC1|nr:hypothetical protein [Stenotrophomonas koreensis]
MSPVQEFSQLAAQGDLRGIKRLYARQLKLTRPDDDALAFQQLHHAYQQALAACRDGLHGDELESPAPSALTTAVDNGSAAPAVAAAAVVGQPQTPVVQVCGELEDNLPATPDDAAEQLLALSDGLDDERFYRRIRHQMRQWPLDSHWAIGKALYHRLHNHPPALPQGHVHALAHVMGWDDVVNGIDPMEIQWMAAMAQQQWLLQPAQQSNLRYELNQYARRQQDNPKELTGKQVRTMVANLTTDLPAWRRYLMLLLPSQSTHYRYLLDVLRHIPGTQARPPLNAQTVAWLDRSHSVRTREQLSYLLCRCVLVSLCIGLPAGALLLHGTDAINATAAMVVVLACVMAGIGLFSVMTAYRALLDWQTLPETSRSRYRLLRLLALPALCLSSATLIFALADRGALYWCAGIVIAGILQRVALLRLAVRRGRPVSVNQIASFAMFMGSVTVFPGLGIALVLWAWDAWTHRRHFQHKAR